MDRDALNIENLAKGFDGRSVLAGLNLSVREGECLALAGPSGCGKTTLLRLVAGLDDADAGRIRLRGAVANDPRVVLPPHRRRVGLVFQDLALWPHLTALQNVEFMLPRAIRGRNQRLAKAGQLLESVHLEGRQDACPHQLSRGQQQQVALARALASEPDLLLLDEPFASQDQELKAQLAGLVREIRQARNITTIYVSHATDEIPRLANCMAFLEQGTLREVRGLAGSAPTEFRRTCRD